MKIKSLSSLSQDEKLDEALENRGKVEDLLYPHLYPLSTRKIDVMPTCYMTEERLEILTFKYENHKAQIIAEKWISDQYKNTECLDLSFAWNVVTVPDFLELTKFFKNIKVLNMSGCRFLSSEVLYYISFLKNLIELDLRDCRWATDLGIKKLIELWKGKKLEIII